MSLLKKYNEKRKFSETPEPEGQLVEAKEKNRFVIQKHRASHEHYDFRLQVGAVLVSWAIPKKPVDDPKVKRLAIKVEDHPLDYIHFEGTIPKGNYGAGTVMVWDVGYYYLDAAKKFPDEDIMEQKLKKGSLKLYLQGAKMKGFFNLVKIHKSGKNEWFMMKAKGSDPEVDYENRSALTGRTMDEIAHSKASWEPEEKKGIATPSRSNLTTKQQAFPDFIPPMLASLTEHAFTKDNWIFEQKLDGYRIVAAKNGSELNLYSRKGNLYQENYYQIAGELSTIKANFIADGEVCYVGKDGNPDFQKLQHNDHEQDRLYYYVFDLLWLNGHDLKTLPLTERKKLLKVLLEKSPKHIYFLDHVEHEGEALFREVEEKGLEGIIGKRADSRYYPGERSQDWLKVKTGLRQEMVICGYIPSQKEGRLFSSLVCAVNENQRLVYTGRVGTGFGDTVQTEIYKKLQASETDQSPLANPPTDSKIQWVKPKLIAEVKFSNWTTDRVMRHSSFVALRSDKRVSQIRKEPSVKTPTETQTKATLTNLSKIFWPKANITKGDVISYYRDIAEVILPYLKDRPQSLYRTPNGIKEKGFFQKNVKDVAPEWAETVELKSSKGKTVDYLLCQDMDTLLFMANLGCIEINPWSSSLPTLDHPDFMVFDLDPVEVSFSDVVKLAVEFRKLFEQLGLPAFCKTSGGRGIHIYVPVQQQYSYQQVQSFVKIIESHIHDANRELTSFERSPSARKGKIYLDYLQNARGKTMASVYSIRPREGALVSAPLRWEELTPKLNPEDFNLQTMRKRLEKEGDLWEDLFSQRVDMRQVLERMNE